MPEGSFEADGDSELESVEQDDGLLQELVNEALCDPRPDIPAREVFAVVYAYHDLVTTITRWRAGQLGG